MSRFHLTSMLLSILLTSAALAGEIKGTVTFDGQPLPGVTVIIVSTGDATVTDADGNYAFKDLASGSYTLRTSLDGFVPIEVTVNLTGASATRDFVLKLDLMAMEEQVVTGTFSPRSKIESSVAITTLSAERIEAQQHRSTADLLKAVPGFYLESSGGEGGNNLFTRGFPGDGSFRYVSMQEDGMPIFQEGELAFTNADLFMRVDGTVENMEGVRGGSASVYASNAPGGIVNMVSKTGGAVLEGNVKLTTGTTGMFRTDLDVGGPMGSDWFFHVGGFYRTDDGVRETGFTGNKGGQIKANLTRVLDNGILRFYVKELNDRNIFYLPIPLQDPDNPSGIPGFDPNEGTMTSSDAALVRVPDPAGNLIERDLTDGMHPQVSSLGLELDLEIGEGWNMNNNLRYIDIDMQFNAIFSLDNPFDGVGFADDTLADYQAANPGSGAVDWRYTYATTGDAFSPANANGNGLVARTGWWFVDKPMTNFADKLQFSKTFGAHNVTFGVYFSDFDVTELWHWSDILTEVKDDPRMLNLELVDAGGNSVVSATENGFLRYGSFYVNHRGEGQIFAGFIGDEAQITDKLRIDAGLRYEFSDFSGSVENGTSLDLGDPTTLADDNFSTGDGSFRRYNWDFDEWAGSLGFNYSFTEGTAVFGRLSRAFRTPDFEQWIFASPDDPEAQQKGTPEEIQQAEVGLKYLTPYYAIFASGYLSELENIPFNDQVVDPDTGEIVTFQRFAGSQTVGLEVEAMYRKDGLGIDFRTTYQNAEYEDFADLTGNQVRRVPELLIDFRPSYQIDNFNLSATWRHYDDRFANDANTVTLPSYDEFHAAVAYHLNKLRFTLSGANLTNEIGLTEGNPRVDPSQVGQQDVYMARPILGRSFNFSVAYSF